MIYQKNELCRIAADTAVREGIPPEFCCAIIDVLSAWSPSLMETSPDPQIFNPALPKAQIEAKLGLMQISSTSAKNLEYKESQMELLEPALNVQIGCKLLKKSLEQCGNNADRALLVTYGYSVASLIPQIQSKVAAYKIFLAQRPT
jgi:hypothetical protein